MSINIPAQQADPPAEDGERDRQSVGLTRVPPQDLEAEQSVIGALLLSGSPGSASYRYFAEILESGIVAEEYYRPAHQMIHRAICALHVAGEAVDAITVADELTRSGELARVGGAAYLHACVQTVPTAANGPQYAEIVRAKAYGGRSSRPLSASSSTPTASRATRTRSATWSSSSSHSGGGGAAAA